MKKLFFIILSLVCLASNVSAGSLDKLYRDLVQADNEGYLPMFMKEQNKENISIEKQISNIPSSPTSTLSNSSVPQAVDFINIKQQQEEQEKIRLKIWADTIKAVEENRVTPVVLAEIIKQCEQKNPHAIEIYAWMNTRGVGVKPNFIQAFKLYQQAHLLGVKDAEKNAAQIYRVLTPDQRAQLAQEY